MHWYIDGFTFSQQASHHFRQIVRAVLAFPLDSVPWDASSSASCCSLTISLSVIRGNIWGLLSCLLGGLTCHSMVIAIFGCSNCQISMNWYFWFFVQPWLNGSWSNLHRTIKLPSQTVLPWLNKNNKSSDAESQIHISCKWKEHLVNKGIEMLFPLTT